MTWKVCEVNVKAVVFRPDRTNEIYRIKRKRVVEGVMRLGGQTYLIDPDRVQITHEKPGRYGGLRKVYYATYYYKQGMAKPIPAPYFKGWFKEGKDGELDMRNVVDNGIGASELNAIFNPWFYRIIAPAARTAWDYIQLYGIIGCAVMLVYITYILSTGNYAEPLSDAVQGAANAPKPTPTPTGGFPNQ